jgi:hypothetical protein
MCTEKHELRAELGNMYPTWPVIEAVIDVGSQLSVKIRLCKHWKSVESRNIGDQQYEDIVLG